MCKRTKTSCISGKSLFLISNLLRFYQEIAISAKKLKKKFAINTMVKIAYKKFKKKTQRINIVNQLYLNFKKEDCMQST